MSKLGIIAIEWHTEAVKWAIENKPTAFEFMMTRPLCTAPMEEIRPGVKVSQVDLIRMLAEASPKTLLVIRAYPDDYEHPDFQDRILGWTEPFREVSNRVVAHSINEPVIFNAEDARRLNEYELGFIENMVSHGLIPMCFCLSESHLAGPTIKKDAQGNETAEILDWGNLPLWAYMSEGVAKLADAGGFLGFNEYDWPHWDRSRAWGHKWRLGHWELNLKFLHRYLAESHLPMVGIGEGILDGKIWTSRLPKDDPRHSKPWGYRKIKRPTNLFSEIEGIEGDSYCKRDVAFNLMFAWAPGHPHWNSYDVSVAAGVLATHLHHSPPQYWEPKEEKMEKPIRVKIHDDVRDPHSPVLGVETMEMEEYLRGVIPQEMPPGWPPEALKAQAVAARCYAKNACEHPRHGGDADVCNTICCQAWLPLHFATTDGAVGETEGVVARYEHQVIQAFYSGHCGGHTVPNEEVWEGIPIPYLRGVECIAKGERWGREQYGHRVGMCQWGAHDWAIAGANYVEILCHYYTGIEVDGQEPDWEKKYGNLRNGVETAIRTLQAVLDA